MKKAIIIGAGPAGITAAYELLKKSKEYEVIILEETDAIGGIARTINHNGNRMDIGGHRFFSKDEKVKKWWNELMPIQGKDSFDDIILKRNKKLSPNGPDPEIEDKVMLIRNRISRIYYEKKFFDYPVTMKYQTIKNLGLIRTIKVGFSYLKSTICKLKEINLENFYINRFGRILYSMFFEGYTEKLWGRHPRDISPDWGEQRVKGLSITALIKDIIIKRTSNGKNKNIETSLIEEFYYPKFGPGQLWETAAAEIEKMGGKILKRSKVTKLISQSDKITAVNYINTENNELLTIEGDIFLSSMPLKDLVESIDKNVPEKISNIAKGLPYRDFVTIGLLVNKLNLINETSIKTINNIIPDCWIYVQDIGVKLGRIQIFNNWSPYLIKDIKNTVWIGLEYFCNENDSFWNMTEKESVDFAVNELIKMGILNNKNEILDFHREHVKKAYPAYFDTYAEIDKVIKFIDNFDNLYCIGRNGQHRYNNIDHSMITAFESVNNIITGKKDKNNIWNVNTEKTYHEKC